MRGRTPSVAPFCPLCGAQGQVLEWRIYIYKGGWAKRLPVGYTCPNGHEPGTPEWDDAMGTGPRRRKEQVPQPGDDVDLVSLCPKWGPDTDGLTCVKAARLMYGTESPSRKQVQKARRRLDKIVIDGRLALRVGLRGGPGGGVPGQYFRIDQSEAPCTPVHANVDA